MEEGEIKGEGNYETLYSQYPEVFKKILKETEKNNENKKTNNKLGGRVHVRGFRQQGGEHYNSSHIHTPVTNDVTIGKCRIC